MRRIGRLLFKLVVWSLVFSLVKTSYQPVAAAIREKMSSPPAKEEVVEKLTKMGKDTKNGIATIISTASSKTVSVPVADVTWLEKRLKNGELVNPEGKVFFIVNKNMPFFTEKEKKTAEPYKKFAKLDKYGRCGTAMAVFTKDTMPTEPRGEIGMVKPSGWHSIRYAFIDGKYLYNRCHLLGYQLSGENANEQNLITGTRQLNVDGMEPFESETADYLRAHPKNHVVYRVTPVFLGDNLVASGVLMEIYSIEDNGVLSRCIWVPNVQKNIVINYKDGSAVSADGTPAYGYGNTKEEKEVQESHNEASVSYVLNTKSRKFHSPSCKTVKKISEKNKKEAETTRSTLISEGYSPCGICNP